ncbi:phage tail assembly chaperone [Erythrobacter sp. Alg231-14]|uniref:phage tail assembly chaperone n=1 Tax=Erythrobacter sp. Alg231-14 TaxID=1922225 RepID=UPI000D54C86C
MTREKAVGLCAETSLWWGLASQILGWRPDEFWQSTPAELAAALRPPENIQNTTAPSRDCIAQMLERENNERQS